MRISYQYKIKPNKEQTEKIDNTLEMLRCQYNYLLVRDLAGMKGTDAQ